jgi:hypothetical protein
MIKIILFFTIYVILTMDILLYLEKNMAKLEKEYDFFKSNLNEFKAKHLGKVVVIKDESILGFYDSIDEAIKITIKIHPLGTFLVREIKSNQNDKIMRFHSRVFNAR